MTQNNKKIYRRPPNGRKEKNTKNYGEYELYL